MVVAWNVYRNFYPYWQEVGVDWDAQLEPLLASIDGAATRERQRNSLRHLVSLVRDGHGAVYDSHLTIGHIAVQVEPIDDGLVVTASANPLASIGDRIVSVDGVDLKVWAAKELTQVSGSPQYQRWQLAHAIGGGPVGTSISLGLERDGSRHDVTFAYEKQASQPEPPRPEAISELKDGIWYLDITRASEQAFNSHMDQLSHARVVVVDLRGYPKGKIGLTLLQHLVAQPEHTQWMHLPKYDSPFDKPIGYIDSGWGLAPVAPRITGKIIVLTNGSAISYAESVLGYLNDLHLATIVGAPSAGTNGDIQMFTTPSGYNVVFTGLRVTRHDGVAPYHLRGVTPDVAVSPGLEDIRAGRDVVLEKALQVAN
nr:S41 family peptidase [Pinirhizobacter soli]